ncbi:MAG: class I SAM-dependent methyltransferase [Elusimicrobiota bacterium]|nr:class I SAM-dependent methyltransferase [Elusimicrobiota bacterium]
MKSKKKVDWGLKFFLDVLKLDSLHLGLWEEDDPLTLEGARNAQDRYTNELIDMIPDGVKSVLDAGCGTGVTAKELKEKGCRVVCLNPDRYQEDLFKAKFDNTIEFHRVKFEDYSPEDKETKYDLILMSESSQYMDTKRMIEKARRLLNPGGYLLIADYFRKADTNFYKSCKVKDSFLKRIRKSGFELKKNRDITKNVIPNLTLGKEIYFSYGVPVIEIITGYARDEKPVLASIVKRVFSSKLKKINHYIHKHTQEKLDEDKFKENMEYLFLLYENRNQEEK